MDPGSSAEQLAASLRATVHESQTPKNAEKHQMGVRKNLTIQSFCCWIKTTLYLQQSEEQGYVLRILDERVCKLEAEVVCLLLCVLICEVRLKMSHRLRSHP